MSVRPNLRPFPVITDGDMSGDITSTVTIVDNKTTLSYDISWNGTSPVGAMSVQVSNTYSENPDGSERNAGNWNTVPLTAATNVSGNTGNGFITIDVTSAYAVRLVYTRTSGTGTLQASICAKVF